MGEGPRSERLDQPAAWFTLTQNSLSLPLHLRDRHLNRCAIDDPTSKAANLEMKEAGFTRRSCGFSPGSHRAINTTRLRAVVSLLSLTLADCATTPPAAPPTPAHVQRDAAAREATCPSCEEQIRETARLRQDLANREVELRDLRSNQRDQVRVLQESTREVTRAKVKLRRLATQADAASYIAELEVSLESLRGSLGGTSAVPLMLLAQSILESAAAPFMRGDYGAAMDRAAQAEQLIAVVHDNVGPSSLARVSKEVQLQLAIPLKVTADSKLHRRPLGKAPVVGVLKKDSPLIAYAHKGSWMLVETEDGRTGWIDQIRLVSR